LRESSRQHPAILAFAGLLYFSEGLPYGFINELLPLYMRAEGMSLSSIGLLSTISLAWTIKLFWAPLVDRIGEFRFWIWASLAILAVSLASLSSVSPSQSWLFFSIVTLIALASATQDIAVDGYTITVTSPDLLGRINSIRVTAYRVAIILAGGGLAALATASSWRTAILVAAATSVGILLLATSLPRVPRSAAARAGSMETFRVWLARPGFLSLLLLVLLYRLGDSALAPMIKPYWIDRGYSPAEVGTVTTVIGISFTILGALLGGMIIDRSGLLRALLMFGIVQALSNVGYALVASFDLHRGGIYTAAVVESFTGGLGISAFLAFLMSMCDRKNPATEYALLSALFGVSRSAAGTLSGFATDRIGYAAFFWLTVLLGLPAVFLILRIRSPFWIDTTTSNSIANEA